MPHNRRPGPESTELGREGRALLSTRDSRGGVEPLAGLAVRLRHSAREVLVCAPQDCRERLAPQTRARAAAVAGTIRPDGATVAATLLTGAISRTAAARS